MSETTNDLPARVAVLEQIARSIDSTLTRIESRFDRLEARLDRLDARQADDFRFLVRLHLGQLAALATGFVILLGVMAHGFHWI